MPSTPRRVHVIITTHTADRLAGVLAGLARQSRSPDSITITCDTDEPAIGRVAARWAPRLESCPVRWVRRPHQGLARPGQARNNAVRILLQTDLIAPSDLLVFLDGDIVLGDDVLAGHFRRAQAGAQNILAYRIELDEPTTRGFDAEAYWRRQASLEPTRSQVAALRRRDRRYRRHLALSRLHLARLGLVKAHKPKVISCHHGVLARLFRAVNGYDEVYQDYGREDDDLARRLNSLHPRTAILVAEAVAFHLWHPTRDTPDRRGAAAYQRFKRRDLPVHAEFGLDNPLDQDPVRVDLVSACRDSYAR